MTHARAKVRFTLLALVALVVAAVSPSLVAQATPAPAPYLGLVNLGMPAAPQPYMPSDFALTKHQRQTCGNTIDNGFGPPADGGTCPMIASHGPDCSAPPATHPIGMAYKDELFICHDHLMTAFDPAGAGVLEFQPNVLVDMSAGPATVSISRSTANTTPNGSRDYTEVYFVPFGQQLAYNTDQNIGEVIKEPATFLRVEMRTQGGNTFAVTEQVNGVQRDVPGNNYTTLEQATGLVDSAVTRTPIVMTLSQTHFALSCNGFTFYDAALPMAFPVSQVVPQFEHVSYDPEKDGERPNTWHWSDLAISSAVPYSLQMAMPDAAGDYASLGLGSTITFPPAPAGAFLRFQGFNASYDSFAGGYQISFDGGLTWAHWHDQTPQDNSVASFQQPVPEGATSATLRGPGGWYARDFYVMSLSPVGGTPAPSPTGGTSPTATPMPPTATPQPTPLPPTPTPTPLPVPTPVAITNAPCLVTLNGVQVAGLCTGTFTPK
ncbi:MAG TPA: hypothetical protein VGR57_12930 [Ktedonobacterales bacterium]|nr:hypothetical protein [Ktedonobacterales bacterium]